jgi:hypothetical protein
MTQHLKNTHFRPMVKGKYNISTAANITACGRAADPKTYVLRYTWDDVDCPGCLAALRGKEGRDASGGRS